MRILLLLLQKFKLIYNKANKKKGFFKMDFSIWLGLLPAIIIFIYGIENFSKEIQHAAGTHFNQVIKWATKGPLRATFFGALITAIIQSSAATTIIAMGLVNSGLINFSQSIGLIFGANIGTTITSQLVALNLIIYAPIFIILGFILSLLKTKYNIFGKPIFYLGLLLFALNLVSISVTPLKNDLQLMELLAYTSIPLVGILVGFIVTNLFQSSSVTTGLLVVMSQTGLIGLDQAIPIIFGANIGTTVLSLVVSSRMDTFAKRAAVTHFLFNFIGVIIFIPFLNYLVGFVNQIGGSPAQQVANAHLFFNLVSTLILLVFINYFKIFVEKIVPTKEKEIVLSAKNLVDLDEKKPIEIFAAVIKEFKNSIESLIEMLNESKNILTNPTQNNLRLIKLDAFVEYLYDETKKVLFPVSKKKLSKEDGQQVIFLTRSSKISSEIGKITRKISNIILLSKENEVDFSIEAKQDIEECLSILSANLILVKNNYPNFTEKILSEMHKNDQELRTNINQGYKNYFSRLSEGKAAHGSTFVEVLDLIQDIGSKISELRKMPR